MRTIVPQEKTCRKGILTNVHGDVIFSIVSIASKGRMVSREPMVCMVPIGSRNSMTDEFSKPARKRIVVRSTCLKSSSSGSILSRRERPEESACQNCSENLALEISLRELHAAHKARGSDCKRNASISYIVSKHFFILEHFVCQLKFTVMSMVIPVNTCQYGENVTSVNSKNYYLMRSRI